VSDQVNSTSAHSTHAYTNTPQANVIAGSDYYKLLIGQLLGYKTENVLGYVAASGFPASKEVQQQVADDIRALSDVKPKLPWSPDDDLSVAAAVGSSKPSVKRAAAAWTAKAGGAGFKSSRRR